MFGRLFFDNELNSFLQISSNKKISMILLNGGSNIISEVGNFIKRDTNEIDVVSFIPNNKIFDDGKPGVGKYFSQNENRTVIKVGRFIRKFISKQSFLDFGITDKEIEEFVNLFKSYFTPNKDNLKVVSGDDILKWYLESNYSNSLGSRGGSLWGSCMRQLERNKYMKMYSKNSSICKMLIFLNDDGKLRSRALLWENVSDNKGNVYNVMDRIYSIYEQDITLFKSWAKENGYICKMEQSSKSELLFDVNGASMELELKIKLCFFDFQYFPYLDTFKYFNINDGTLSNNSNSIYQYKLVQTDGALEREECNDDEEMLFDIDDNDDYHF